MTVLELIQKTSSFLEKKGVDEPRLQTELMLAEVLGLKRIQLYLQFERELSESQLGPLRELVRRRAAREPLQYILGRTEFYGLEFGADRRALIPRRETEHVVEAVLNSFPDRNAPIRAIDLGTGSGILAVTLALQMAQSRWTAVDASAEALALARENAARLGAAERISWIEGSWWTNVPAAERFDLIVSNPPYVRQADIAHLAPELRDHEPPAALSGGSDGLDAYRAILATARDHAGPGARLAFEIGFDQGPALRQMLADGGWRCDAVLKDLQGHDRVVTGSLS